MQIPGSALRDTVTIEPALGSDGDSPDTYGPGESFPAAVKTGSKVTTDATGQTTLAWTRIKLRPNVQVTGAAGQRWPAVGDKVTARGTTRVLTHAEPVRGPGTAFSHLELLAE